MSGSVIGLVTIGAGINVVNTVAQKKSPLTMILAATAFGGALIAVSTYVDERLATTIAALYLLGSFLFNGTLFINLLVALTSPKGK